MNLMIKKLIDFFVYEIIIKIIILYYIYNELKN